MNTNTIIEEMGKIGDLRTKQAKELKKKFFELLNVFEKLAEKSHFRLYHILVIDSYKHYAGRAFDYDTNFGDEELWLVYKDGEITPIVKEFVEEDEYAYWKEMDSNGTFRNELIGGWEHLITNRFVFNNIKTLIRKIEKIVEDEKTYIQQQSELIEEAERHTS